LQQEEYTVSIFENSRGGTVVVQLNATDEDTGDFGEIRYQLVGDTSNAFAIDEVTVRHCLLLTAA